MKSMKKSGGHKSFGSPASMGASKGAGPAGAGMHMSPGAGPGSAAKRKMGRAPSETDNSMTPSGAAPKGMKVYAEE